MNLIRPIVLSMLIITYTANLQAIVELFLNNNEQLIESVEKGDKHRVKELLDQETDCNTTDSIDGRTPLHCAAYEANKEIVELLIALGALCTGNLQIWPDTTSLCCLR
jgi:ankyrin repeat protein